MKGSLMEQVRDLMLSMPPVLAVEVFEARKAKIFEIAEACKKTSIYRRSEAVREDFYGPLRHVSRDKAILMSWVHFLDRMAMAPNAAHKEGVVALCFPVISDLLRKK